MTKKSSGKSCLLIVILLMIGILPGILYIAWPRAEGNIFLELQEDGTVRASGRDSGRNRGATRLAVLILGVVVLVAMVGVLVSPSDEDEPVSNTAVVATTTPTALPSEDPRRPFAQLPVACQSLLGDASEYDSSDSWYGVEDLCDARNMTVDEVRAHYANDPDFQKFTAATLESAPIATPSPAPTAIATTEPECPTAAQGIYFGEMAPKLGTISDASIDLGGYFQEMSNDVTLLFDGDWRLNVAVNLALLNITADSIDAVEAPPGTEAIHQNLTRVASLLRSAVENITIGLDDIDPDALDRGVEFVVEATSVLNAGTDTIVTFCD